MVKNSGEVHVSEVQMDDVISRMLEERSPDTFRKFNSSVQKEKYLQVKKSDSNLHILNGVTFDLYKGKCSGSEALSGQGQAELLQALYGVIRANGEIILNGKKYVSGRRKTVSAMELRWCRKKEEYRD